MDFMTREVFDALVVAVILIGSVLAARRLWADFTRPLDGPDERSTSPARPSWADDDTDPHVTD